MVVDQKGGGTSTANFSSYLPPLRPNGLTTENCAFVLRVLLSLEAHSTGAFADNGSLGPFSYFER